MVKLSNWSCGMLISISLFVSIVSAAVTNEALSVDGSSIPARGDADLKVTTPVSAQQLWDKFYTDTILPKGVTNLSVEYSTGANYPEAAGLYTGLGTIAGIDPKDGILLTSGKPTLAIGPNDSEMEGEDHDASNENSGDDDLFNMLPTTEHKTYDACLFTLKFTTDTSVHGLTFDFVFGTDEYPEFVNSPYNDIFCAFLDGKNITFDHDGNYISVNNNFFKVPNTDDSKDYNGVDLNPPPNAHLNLEYDGFTPLLRTSDTLTEGKHVLKFAIADVGDHIYDAGVFLSNFKFEYSGQGTDPVTVTILADQQYTVADDAPAGTHVGNVLLNTSNPSGVTVTVINNVPEFEISSSDPFEITVANGANLDVNVTDSYILTVVAIGGSGPNATYDTSNIVITITGNTETISTGNILNTLTCLVVNGDNLTINGLTGGTYNLGITNLKGQDILKIVNGSKAVIDISTVHSGIYFVSITSKNGKIFSKIHIGQ